MGFIEYADGTVYDPELEKERKEKIEQKIKDAEYEKYMKKVRDSAERNTTPFTVTPLYYVEDYNGFF